MQLWKTAAIIVEAERKKYHQTMDLVYKAIELKVKSKA